MNKIDEQPNQATKTLPVKKASSENIDAAKKKASTQLNVQHAVQEIEEDKNKMRDDQEKAEIHNEGLEQKKGKDLLVDPASSVKSM